MKFQGFEEKDFDLFLIPGLEDRMSVLKSQLQPKFAQLAEILTEELSVITGDAMYAHIAKHARRTTNPPADSWVAFSTNNRGYKMLPHFQITLWPTHLLIQWGIIYEAKNKEVFARNMMQNIEEIQKKIPNHYYWNKDHTKPYGVQQSSLSKEELLEVAQRVAKYKNGEIMVGHLLQRDEALSIKPNDFINLIVETWSNLNILHKMAY